MAPSGIEPATLRLVAQCLNQLRYRVPRNLCGVMLNVMGFSPIQRTKMNVKIRDISDSVEKNLQLARKKKNAARAVTLLLCLECRMHYF